ncbi:MAG TPA: sodium-translocating pyrophosphatase, partial [Sedimenticola thiotaurini]|nr:sodium-translocating pyrophosphatase [Sedimenticola thiotaurini]
MGETSLILLLVLGAAATGILYASWAAYWVLGKPRGDAALQAPYQAIREGAAAFMRIQYGTILAAGSVIFVVLWLAPGFGFLTAVGFLIGALFSAFSGIAGMLVSVRSNVRTAAAAMEGIRPALLTAQRAGSVTGFLVGGLALASVTLFYALLAWLAQGQSVDLRPLAGLGFGASLVSVFARLGGGIFTKAADVGADLAGKIEQGIPEDDPRNPAVIADNVGDNVGDCAGMAADIFESYAITLVAAMLVAAWSMPGDISAQLYPLLLGGAAMLASVVGINGFRFGSGGSAIGILSRGLLTVMVLSGVVFYGVTAWLFGSGSGHSVNALSITAITGLVVGAGMLATTNYFTSSRYPPVRRIARASRSGHATNIITGLAVGMKSAVVPTVVIAAGIIVAYQLSGVYGIAVATCGLLALTPIIVSVDAFGPVTDNAGGIIEMAGSPERARDATDALDAAGNTTKALTKVFAIGSAGLASLVLLVAFELAFGSASGSLDFALDDPYVLAGIFIGSLLPFVFSGYAMESVGRAASNVVLEVRRQFEADPGILQGIHKPDYGRTVGQLTRASLRGMIIPGAIPVVVPLIYAFLWRPFGPAGSAALLMGGTLIGAVGSGLILALFMSTGGAAWDNAKKYIEEGHEGGKGSPAHHAAITGDTVGDPFKDTAGP